MNLMDAICEHIIREDKRSSSKQIMDKICDEYVSKLQTALPEITFDESASNRIRFNNIRYIAGSSEAYKIDKKEITIELLVDYKGPDVLSNSYTISLISQKFTRYNYGEYTHGEPISHCGCSLREGSTDVSYGKYSIDDFIQAVRAELDKLK